MNYINNKTLLDLRFSNGMLLLPFFRYDIMKYLNPKQAVVNQSGGLKRVSWYKGFFKNLKMCKVSRCKIAYFTSTLFNVKNEKGEYINTMDGYYYNLYPNESLLIENSDGLYNWRPKGCYPHLSYINSYLSHVSLLLGKVINKFVKNNNPALRKLEDLYPDLFDLGSLQVLDYSVRIYSGFVHTLLKKLGCKLIFVNSACYGDYNSILISEAHKLGIKVIEQQHGFIDKGHLAYNAEPDLLNCLEYSFFLPDEIWTFGDFWNNRIGWNITKKTVGNPHLNYYLNKYGKAIQNIDYLFISQPFSDFYTIINNTVEALHNLDSSARIVVRLHPRDKKETFEKLLTLSDKIQLSTSSTNLYDDISRAKKVIGFYSTCLYEAIGFGINPYIIDCEKSRMFFDKDMGIWIHDVTEIINKSKEECVIESQRIWNPDFETRVRTYIEKYLQG